MARLKSEIEVPCLLPRAVAIDINPGASSRTTSRIGNKPELARRAFSLRKRRGAGDLQQSVDSEESRDVLSRRFDEALRQAKDEPVTADARFRFD